MAAKMPDNRGSRSKSAGTSHRTPAPYAGRSVAATAVPAEAAPRSESVLPIAARIPEAMRISGLSRAAIYRGWNAGRIQFRKAGRSTLVLMDSLRRYLAELPAAEPRRRTAKAPTQTR